MKEEHCCVFNVGVVTGALTIAEERTEIAVCVPACTQGQSGNPFFDCVTMNSGVPPFKSFVQANGNNAQTLANHFVSYLKGNPTREPPAAPSFSSNSSVLTMRHGLFPSCCKLCAEVARGYQPEQTCHDPLSLHAWLQITLR